MKFDDKYLIIRTANGWDYEIPISDLMVLDGLKKWVFHMTEKSWFSKSMAKYMIEMCEHKFGYSY